MVNLKGFRVENNVSQKEICRLLGIKQPYLSAIETGKRPLNNKRLKIIIAEYGDIVKKYISDEYKPTPIKRLSGQKSIRYYDIDASAGPIEMFEPGNTTVFKELIIPGFNDCDVALNVWGDSMEPVLNKGEIILCKEWSESYIEYGYMYLIITLQNHRMIKYLKKAADESKIVCTSANSFYDPFEISKSDILKLYMVKGHIERSAI